MNGTFLLSAATAYPASDFAMLGIFMLVTGVILIALALVAGAELAPMSYIVGWLGLTLLFGGATSLASQHGVTPLTWVFGIIAALIVVLGLGIIVWGVVMNIREG